MCGTYLDVKIHGAELGCHVTTTHTTGLSNLGANCNGADPRI